MPTWRHIYTGLPGSSELKAHLLGLSGRTIKVTVKEGPAAPSPPDRRPLAIIAMNGSPTTPDGMAAWWTRDRNDADAVTSLIERLDALAALGYTRIMLHMPAGWTWTANLRTFPASQWYSLPASRRAELERRLPAWFAANPGVELIVYTGFGVVADPTHNSHRGMMTPDNGLDPADCYHQVRMDDNVRGWRDMAGEQWGGVMVDALSKWRDQAAPWADALDYPLLGEAIPTLRDADGGWILDVDAIAASGIPWLATDSFMRPRDPNREWIAPPGAELIVWSGQDRSEGSPAAPDLDELRSWVERGFTLASHRPEWVVAIAEIRGEGPQGEEAQ